MKDWLKNNWSILLIKCALFLFVALGAFLFFLPLIFGHGHYTIETPKLSLSLIFWGTIWLVLSIILFIKFIKKGECYHWWEIVILIFCSPLLSFFITGMIWYILKSIFS